MSDDEWPPDHRELKIGSLAKAMCIAQSRIRGAVKDSVNPGFRSKYADLASIWEACREALTSAGVATFQVPRMRGDEMVLVTILAHESGEYLQGTYPIRPVKPDPQSTGSALTYARRYSLAAMVGVVADEDDDGNSATSGSYQDRGPYEPPPQQARRAAPKARAKAEPEKDSVQESLDAELLPYVTTIGNCDTWADLDRVRASLRAQFRGSKGKSIVIESIQLEIQKRERHLTSMLGPRPTEVTEPTGDAPPPE